MPSFSLYLSERRAEFIKKHTKGTAEYVNKKIDEDMAKLLSLKYCEEQIIFWKKQKQKAIRRKKRGEK